MEREVLQSNRGYDDEVPFHERNLRSAVGGWNRAGLHDEIWAHSFKGTYILPPETTRQRERGRRSA